MNLSGWRKRSGGRKGKDWLVNNLIVDCFASGGRKLCGGCFFRIEKMKRLVGLQSCGGLFFKWLE